MLALLWLLGLVTAASSQQLGTAYSSSNQQQPTLRVGTIVSAPFLMLRRGVEEGYQGFILDLLDTLSLRQGFNYQIKLSTDNMYGVRDEGGNWTGLMGMLERGEIDLIAADLTVSWSRMEAVDFSRPFLSSYLTVLIKKPEVELTYSALSWLEPFTPLLWMYLVLSYLATSLFLWIVIRLSPGEDRPSPSLLDCAWYCFAPWSSTHHFSIKTLPSRLLVGVWWLTLLCFLVLYFLQLPGFLDPRRHLGPPKMESVAQALEQGVPLGVVQGGSSRMLLEKSVNPLHQKIWETVAQSPSQYLVSSYESGLARVHSTPGEFGMVMESSAAGYLASMDCSLYTLDNLEDRHYALAFRKGSGLKRQFSRGLLQASEAGVISGLRLKWWPPLPASSCPESTSGVARPLCRDIHQLSSYSLLPVLVVLLTSLLVALLVAVLLLLVRLGRERRLAHLPQYLKLAFFPPPPQPDTPKKKNPSVATQTVLWASSRQQTPTSSPTPLSHRIFYEGR